MFARFLLTTAVIAALAACSDSTAPPAATCSGETGPPWPATVTGCWVQPSVDTYTLLNLVQDGTAITGTVSFCGVVGGPPATCAPPQEVTGTVVSSRVTLEWADARTDATLVPTADSLSNDTIFTGSGSGVRTASFVRTRWR